MKKDCTCKEPIEMEPSIFKSNDFGPFIVAMSLVLGILILALTTVSAGELVETELVELARQPGCSKPSNELVYYAKLESADLAVVEVTYQCDSRGEDRRSIERVIELGKAINYEFKWAGDPDWARIITVRVAYPFIETGSTW